MIRILLVCTGNVCRSPMAEGLLRKMLRDGGDHGEFVVESAGTAAVGGIPASSAAVETASGHGVDIRGHVSRAVSSRLVERADLILAMEPEHVEMLAASYPTSSEKIHLVTQYADRSGDPLGIPDPVGQGIDVYERTWILIEDSLQRAIPAILELIPGEPELDVQDEEAGDGRKEGQR
ncbi:MAG: low molecular weight protein arginine phosphatase [Candidatus Eisenbacteria bacterium]|nr:low molecular weight protein arginine phosphatase [Candidatus Eisenbacteria bacterium]